MQTHVVAIPRTTRTGRVRSAADEDLGTTFSPPWEAACDKPALFDCAQPLLLAKNAHQGISRLLADRSFADVEPRERMKTIEREVAAALSEDPPPEVLERWNGILMRLNRKPRRLHQNINDLWRGRVVHVHNPSSPEGRIRLAVVVSSNTLIVERRIRVAVVVPIQPIERSHVIAQGKPVVEFMLQGRRTRFLVHGDRVGAVAPNRLAPLQYYRTPEVCPRRDTDEIARAALAHLDINPDLLGG